ncbi:MAG: hypothetical protein MUE40_21105, partial [Anaerolineae bacterium]|nr:hypothetical protein [Anaerolineae bacterium]
EFLQLDEVLIGMFQSSRQTVHLYINLTGLKSLPALFVLQNTKTRLQPNLGWSVAYGAGNALIRTLMTVAASTFGMKLRLYRTAEEAARFLPLVDKSLPALTAAR